jgi:hypothetical protein
VGDRDRTQRWDPADTDAGRILEVAGLHQAAGGVAYTGLELGRFARLDLSPLLAVDRGILVGLAVDGSRGTDWSVMLRSEAGDQAGEGAGLPIEAAAASLVRIVIPLAAAPTPEAP